MKIERNGKMLILSGNDLFGMIGIAAIFFFCVGIRNEHCLKLRRRNVCSVV